MFNSTLNRNSTLSPGGRLRRQSKRTKAKARDRKKCVDKVKARSGGVCEVPGCGRRARDVHEILKRSRGGSPYDPENTLHLCDVHHDWTETDPAAATEAGLLRTRTAEEFREAVGL